MSASPAAASRARFIGIFVLSLCALSYQVLLTRIFSVALYYHFTFAGISLAMLGLTVGAERVYLNPERYAADRFNAAWAEAALGFAISSVALVLWFLTAPLVLPDRFADMALICSLMFFIIPFTYSGICVTLILTRSLAVGKLYAADLVGAALGCVGIVAFLFFLDPVTILFLLAAYSAYAAWRMAHGTSAKLTRRARTVMLLMLAAGAVQGTLYLSGYAGLGIFWAKGQKQQSLLFERWNAFSRVSVVDWKSRTPFGWGFGRPQTGNIDQHYLDIDANAGTIITHFDGDLKPLAFLADDVINVGYHLRPVDSVAVIGVGGGRDVMSALYFGAKHIIAIELNPSIIEALTRNFADFTGHFTERPEVTLINAEARSWLAQHRPKVDLVQISLIDTWAATAAGGLTLSENRLYTLEAWKEFLSTLTPKGMLVVSRWYGATDYKGEFYRLLSLASESLAAQGVPRADIRQHILAFNVNNIVTVAVSPAGFSPDEVAHAHAMMNDLGFNVMVAPDFAVDETSRVIASGGATQAFYDSLPIDVSVPTDNRPFFFYMTRLRNILKEGGASMWEFGRTNSALTVLVVLLLGTLLITIAAVVQPLVKLSATIPVKGAVFDLLYFACIGAGFMLIEISQMQRLMVFLGHPVYGLSVVLFTLLVFGGIGSATVHDYVRPERLWTRALLLCLALSVIGVCTPGLTAEFTPFGTGARIMVSVLLLAPAGLCMGMMFPAGMIMSAQHRTLQPWFWGINGATSVFASILGVLISEQFGIAQAYWTGTAAYGICLVLMLMKRSKDRP